MAARATILTTLPRLTVRMGHAWFLIGHVVGRGMRRQYGEIPGYPEGSEFASRRELADAGVHRPLQAGISGGKDGADSIVVSGGYPDDEDTGDEIVYTGHGGRDPDTGRQVADQELLRGNLGLVQSEEDHRPIRVIRGSGGDPAYSPSRGFRYDGLYQVVDHWCEAGRDGCQIWRFRLTKLSSPEENHRTERPLRSMS